MKYTILILVNATNQWLSMPRHERDVFVETEVRPIFDKYRDACDIKLFDADFTNSNVSDFLIVETSDMNAFGYMIGYLRESKTFAVPYFSIRELIIGVPNNFRGSLSIGDITGAR
ncbi:MAG TPA: darcynin family protein [Chitinophaga sp.]|uniref:darcynin family protein n=1 Tax=Chitinophaga sp. TaxID=1869181 RepID=UPI002C584235|nr:darcynin family protein [Chitinophaga sp.]HVI43213.1 darcynin family protein [Chitinophaga sp.]